MTVLSYKEFMEKVRVRLGTLSNEDFWNLILNWASEEHPSKKREFLDKLTPTKQKKEVISDEWTLMDEIEAFAQRVENGENCDGWGWDEDIHEERDWGGESWAEEMDEFFLQARSLLLQGNMISASEERPASLYEAMNEYGYLAYKVKLRNMMDVLDSLLPDFDAFLAEWIDFLKN